MHTARCICYNFREGNVIKDRRDRTKREQMLYAFAGGAEAMQRLAAAHYRRCLTDPVLTQVFGKTGRPGHVEHLAAWLGEVFGGPATYSEHLGGHAGMVRHHLRLGITEEQRQRFVEAMMESAAEVGLPDDPEFRQQLREYFEWGSGVAKYFSNASDPHPPESEPTPLWGWDGRIKG
jgi:hemoglobin